MAQKQTTKKRLTEVERLLSDQKEPLKATRLRRRISPPYVKPTHGKSPEADTSTTEQSTDKFTDSFKISQPYPKPHTPQPNRSLTINPLSPLSSPLPQSPFSPTDSIYYSLSETFNRPPLFSSTPRPSNSRDSSPPSNFNFTFNSQKEDTLLAEAETPSNPKNPSNHSSINLQTAEEPSKDSQIEKELSENPENSQRDSFFDSFKNPSWPNTSSLFPIPQNFTELVQNKLKSLSQSFPFYSKKQKTKKTNSLSDIYQNPSSDIPFNPLSDNQPSMTDFENELLEFKDGPPAHEDHCEKIDVEQLHRFTLEVRTQLLKSLPKFSGNTALAWREYMMSFNTIAKALGLSYQEAAQLLPACLEGTAAEKFAMLRRPPQGHVYKFNDLVNNIAKLLSKPFENELAMEQLNARKQRKEEELETYMKDIKRLVKLAYNDGAGYTEQQRTREVVRWFIRGLKPDLREHISRMKKPNTPEELLTETIREQELQKQLARERAVDALAINLTQMQIQDRQQPDSQRDDRQQNFGNNSNERFSNQRPNRFGNNRFNNNGKYKMMPTKLEKKLTGNIRTKMDTTKKKEI